MSRRPRDLALLLALGIFLPFTPDVRADAVIEFTWTGRGASESWYDDGNWAGGEAPPDDGTANVIFGNAGRTFLTYYAVDIHGLTFSGNTQPYRLLGSYETTHIGAGGITYTPAGSVRSVISDAIKLEASQTWNIASGSLTIDGSISDSYSSGETVYYNDYSITKTGAGTLFLSSPYSSYWSGGLILSSGNVVIPTKSGNTEALGFGPLTFDGGTLVIANGSGESALLNNHIISNGFVSLNSSTDVHFYATSEDDGFELTADTTISSRGGPLYIESDIFETGGARKLTIESAGAVVLTGRNSYTGGTVVTKGALIFGEAYSIPSVNLESSTVGHLTAGPRGYIGFGDSSYTSSVQSYFIDDFDKAGTSGTIGLDTDPSAGTPNTFTGNIDLTGFATNARLGSSTRAILTGTITPQGTDYRFGGGGGLLQVDSAFTDHSGNSAIRLDSPEEAPLTLRLTNLGGNSFSGGMYVTQSAAIFATGALPTQIIANNWATGTGGYIGYEGVNYDADRGTSTQTATINDFLGRFNSANPAGIIGFDANPGVANSGHLSGAIDLGSFTGALYLGTSTAGYDSEGTYSANVVLSGAITTTNGGADPYRFTGYKGGALQVNSTLTGSAGVIIGDPASPATFGDFINKEYSKVILNGNNSGLSGNITFYGGALGVGQANGVTGTDPTNALGTGSLIVQPFSFPADIPLVDDDLPVAQLRTLGDDLIIPNNIQLNARLSAGGNNMELAGTISGSGGLYLEDGIGLALSGNNTFGGGVYIEDNAYLDLYHNNASGTGAIKFGGGANGEIYFNTDHPVIGGLESTDNSYLSLQSPNSILTVNQAANSSFSGEVRTFDSSDAVRFVKSGTGTLRLDDGGLYYHHGVAGTSLSGDPEVGLQVDQGTLIIGNSFNLEDSAPTVWVHGGTLALDHSNFSNPVVVDNHGRLTGAGTLGTVTLAASATIAPGLGNGSPIGHLDINTHLTVKGGSTYEWNLASVSGDMGTADLISVGSSPTLEFAATSADKFTLKAISIALDGNPGTLLGLEAEHSYSWVLFSATHIGGFDASAFDLDVSMFVTNLGTGLAIGTYTVSLSEEDTLVNLNLTTFAGIPEPSTYALLASGLSLVGLGFWRKSRRRA